MGRKIPGRKHRGVKDPEKQRQDRFAKIKDKINAPPTNITDQEIPKSLARIIELKNKVKMGLFNKKKDQKKKDNHFPNKKPLKGKPEKPIIRFIQRPGESNRDFKHRMSLMCSDAIKEAAFEDKYKIDIRRNERGQVEKILKRPKDELEVLAKKALKEEKLKKKGIKLKKKDNKLKAESQPKLTKSQKWARKKAEKKNKKINLVQEDQIEVQRENVKFGDIVHAPPSLVIPRKAKQLDKDSQGAPRPGRKDLLLKSMMENKSRTPESLVKNNNDNKTKLTTSKVKTSVNKKGKRKDLPVGLRRQLDKQQKDVIEAYKLLKSKKYGNSS